MGIKNKWSRGVSIIGAAYTPFGNVLETPAIKGMTYRELISWAALEAMERAGITSKEVDSLLVAHYQTEPVITHCTHAVAAEWLGLKRKPSVTFETACASGISGVRLAGSLIASGIDDIVVVAAAEVLNSTIDEDLEYRKQPAARIPLDFERQMEFVRRGFDQGYIHPIAADLVGGISVFPMLAYAKKYGLNIGQVDEAQCAASINLRRNAARNPRASQQKEFKDIAQEAGFSDVMSYMKSPYNPWLSWPVRTCHSYSPADGGAALVLCATEEAKKYTNKPIDLVGVGLAAGLFYEADPLNLTIEQSAFRQAYTMADLNPQEIDYLGLHDCFVHQHMTVSEMAGYFGPGESWQAIIEGRTAFDGDKPINTHGGCPSMGNAYDVSGIVEMAEATLQMMGKCDQRQIDSPPECSVVHALGSGPTFGVSVLRRRE
jgi:acetyl-CoA C-acetyltransferase